MFRAVLNGLNYNTTKFSTLFYNNVYFRFTNMASVTSETIVKKIGTHNGIFHCDEALACFMLKQLDCFQNAEIIRTRDPNLLDSCDIVVDVGGVYDPQNNKYDHHQRTFDKTLSSVCPDLAKNKTIKLSSAGLIYAHYGIKILMQVLKNANIQCTPEEIEIIFRTVYDNFIEELDAIDNGVPMFAEGTPKYKISTSLSSRVHHLNPTWNCEEKVNTDELFQKAMDLVGKEFTERVLNTIKVWHPARKIVHAAINNRLNVHSSGKILEFDQCCPWKEHLMQLESELGIQNEIKFVIFKDSSNDTWRVQCVPIQPDSFICRIFLPKDWQGVRDEKLSEISGIEGCIFCHATGFIGGNKTREGALQMALKSIEQVQNNQLHQD